MRAYPEFVGGTDRDVTHLMRGVPGLVAKDGAEAVQAMVVEVDGHFRSRRQIEDGAQRAPVGRGWAALEALGIVTPVTGRTARQIRSWAVVGQWDGSGRPRSWTICGSRATDGCRGSGRGECASTVREGERLNESDHPAVVFIQPLTGTARRAAVVVRIVPRRNSDVQRVSGTRSGPEICAVIRTNLRYPEHSRRDTIFTGAYSRNTGCADPPLNRAAPSEL